MPYWLLMLQAVTETAVTRAFLPAPILVVPPIIMTLLERLVIIIYAVTGSFIILTCYHGYFIIINFCGSVLGLHNGTITDTKIYCEKIIVVSNNKVFK